MSIIWLPMKLFWHRKFAFTTNSCIRDISRETIQMKIAIIDDFAEDRQLLTSYLNLYFSKFHANVPLCIQGYTNGEDFLSSSLRNNYDIIFIDYYMPKISGMETASQIRTTDSSVALIFTTTSNDHAIDGYLVKASGYLLKPLTYEKLAETLALLDFKKIKDRQIVEFENGTEKVKIVLKDIVHCDISGHYTQVYTLHSGTQRIRIPFSKLTDALSPYPEFLHCYRGCLVNMNQIVQIEKESFVMTDGSRIPLRRKEQFEIVRAYSEFVFEKVRNKEL